MKCPSCEEDVWVEISDDYSEVVCYNCGWFHPAKFSSADEAFFFTEEDL